MSWLALLQALCAAAGLYAASLGFVLLWFWQLAAQGRDPWTEDRSTR